MQTLLLHGLLHPELWSSLPLPRKNHQAPESCWVLTIFTFLLVLGPWGRKLKYGHWDGSHHRQEVESKMAGFASLSLSSTGTRVRATQPAFFVPTCFFLLGCCSYLCPVTPMPLSSCPSLIYTILDGFLHTSLLGLLYPSQWKPCGSFISHWDRNLMQTT